MHQGRVLTDPMGNGPGRMLGLASAYVTISEDKTFEKNPELLPVHKEAKATLENNFVMGPLEQYILYHNAISYLDDYLRDLFRDSIVIFVPSLTATSYEEKRIIGSDEFKTELMPYSSNRIGADITSLFSVIGAKLRDMCTQLQIDYERDLSSGDFRPEEASKNLLFIPVAPFLSVVSFDGLTIRNIFGENIELNDDTYNIREQVNAVMDQKGKITMGSTVLEGITEAPFYWYLPSFIDKDAAARFYRKHDMTFSEYKSQVSLYTRYNRLLISEMYAHLISLLPEETEVVPFLCKTSPLTDILHRAARKNNRLLYDLNIMDNVKEPIMGEASLGAINILRQYIIHQRVGQRKTLRRDTFRK